MGTQQPCNLAPVLFWLIKHLQKKSTAKDVTSCGLAQTIDEYFTLYLRLKGLNLDDNLRKKKDLIDFTPSLPEFLEETMKRKHIRKSFVKPGIIDEETGTVPVFNKFIGTCKRW